MWKVPKALRLPGLTVLVAGAALSLGAQTLTPAAVAAPAAPAPRHAAVMVAPNKTGGLDCNGLSPIQHPVKADMACADPRGPSIWGGRFFENGHYIGHDEPSMRFVSSRPGSGDNFSMNETMPADPAAMPTVKTPGHDVTHWFELSVAPWISTTVCDPNSAPLGVVQAGVRRQRAARQVPGWRPGVRGAAVLPARLRPVRGRDQLRQHALVLGADHRQPGVHRDRERLLQQQLHRAGELRVHPDQRRAHRAAQPAEVGPGHRARPTRTRC